jgi:hypothetical protein
VSSAPIKKPRSRWYERIPKALKERIDAAIDTGLASWSEIYAEYNLRRLIGPRGFRAYKTKRRERYERERTLKLTRVRIGQPPASTPARSGADAGPAAEGAQA